MEAPAYAEVDDTWAPLESTDYKQKDKRQGLRQILTQPPSQEELESYRERVREAVYQHDGTPAEVLEKAVLLPDVLYRTFEHVCYGRLSDAKKTMQTYVVGVSRELMRTTNNPEYAIAFYEILGDGLAALGTVDRRAVAIAAVLKPSLERLIRKEKGRLKKKHELEELVGE